MLAVRKNSLTRKLGVRAISRTAFLLTALLNGGCDAPQSNAFGNVSKSGQSRAELKGGALESEPSAVVSIDREGVFVCTGTLVGPRIVVTAAHCGLLRDEIVTVSNSQTAAGTNGATVIDFDLHPSYRRELWPDLAVLALDASVPGAIPAGVHDPSEPIRAGDGVVVAGFGRTTPTEGPTERTGRALIVEVHEDNLVLEGDGSQPCHGDSGGPVFVESPDGSPLLLGVISNGDEACSGHFNAARIDTQAEVILTPYIARIQLESAPSGARCFDDASCESGICSKAETGLSTCALDCSTNPSCPSGATCVEAAGRRVCRTEPIVGAVGSGCDDDRDCASGICTQRDNGPICATACTPTTQKACPSGFACVSNDTEPEPFLCVPIAKPHETSGGCSIATFSQSHRHKTEQPYRNHVFVAVVALLAALLHLRRRHEGRTL